MSGTCSMTSNATTVENLVVGVPYVSYAGKVRSEKYNGVNAASKSHKP